MPRQLLSQADDALAGRLAYLMMSAMALAGLGFALAAHWIARYGIKPA